MSKTKSILQGLMLTLIALAAMVSMAANIIENSPKVPEKPLAYFFNELSEKLFLNAGKAKDILDEGHVIILIKSFDSETKRPRLAAAKQTPGGVEEIESAWFQPSLVYLMDAERIIIQRSTKNQITVQGISLDTLAWMARN